MIKTALINGSPKGDRSASRVILDFVAQGLPKEHFDLTHVALTTPQMDPTILEEIVSSSILLLAFPLYVDGVPSHVLRWLVELEKVYTKKEGTKPLVYAFVNCGFYEAEQTHITLEILRNWCEKAALTWAQGMGIGAGGVFVGLRNVPLGRWPFRALGQAMDAMGQNIRNQAGAPDLFVSPDFPRLAYKAVAEFGWRRSILRNGLRLRDLHRKVEMEQPRSSTETN